jgi:hypothetical protein
MSKRIQLQCKDCYFHQEALCALQLDAPCPTFRYGARGALAVPQQAQLIPRAFAAAGPPRLLPQRAA